MTEPLDPREDVTSFLACMPGGLLPALTLMAEDQPPALAHITEARRAVQLEDAGRALAHMGAGGLMLRPLTTPAQAEAARVFSFAGTAWAVFLEEVSTPPAVMAARIELWATGHVFRSSAPLPGPLHRTLSEVFPDVGPWYALARVSDAMTAKGAGACAAWWAVGTIAACCAAQGFEDGWGEDLCVSVLEGLEDPAPRILN